MCSLTSNATQLSAFEVRSIQAAKSKSSSCPRIKPCRELWPICQALLASKFGKWELLLDLQTFSCIIHHVNPRTRCNRTFPACIAITFGRARQDKISKTRQDKARQDKTRQYLLTPTLTNYKACFFLFYSNIILANIRSNRMKPRCLIQVVLVLFKSAWFVVGSAAMQMYAVLYVAQKG